jgi:hypothetical protein
MENNVNPSRQDGKALGLSRILILVGLLFAQSLNSKTTEGEQDFQADEYEIKAAYLLNFANFVDWPDTQNGGPQTPIQVCLLGQDPLGTTLARMMTDHLPHGRSLLLRRVLRTEPISNCQILYIGPSEGKYVPQIIDSLGNASILTVGENDQFATQGGIIQLVMEDKRIRFKINATAASLVGIHISSRLLALAQIVTTSAKR